MYLSLQAPVDEDEDKEEYITLGKYGKLKLAITG